MVMAVMVAMVVIVVMGGSIPVPDSLGFAEIRWHSPMNFLETDRLRLRPQTIDLNSYPLRSSGIRTYTLLPPSALAMFFLLFLPFFEFLESNLSRLLIQSLLCQPPTLLYTKL